MAGELNAVALINPRDLPTHNPQNPKGLVEIGTVNEVYCSLMRGIDANSLRGAENYLTFRNYRVSLPEGRIERRARAFR